jgi:hypothetical protein
MVVFVTRSHINNIKIINSFSLSFLPLKEGTNPGANPRRIGDRLVELLDPTT